MQEVFVITTIAWFVYFWSSVAFSINYSTFFYIHWYYLLLSVVCTREAGWTSFCCAIQYCCTVQCDWACRHNSEVCELRKTWNFTHGLNWRTCIWHTVQHLQMVVLRLYRDRCPKLRITHHTTFSSIHRRLSQLGTVHRRVDGNKPIGDSTPTSRWQRTGHFVRTCRGTVLQYVENNVPLALKRSIAAHRFLNKICFNEGYLSGPKVCQSNLETLCIKTYICMDIRALMINYSHMIPGEKCRLNFLIFVL